MTNKLPSSNKNKWALLRRWLPVCFFASWIVGTAAIWTTFALVPAGALASADAGELVAIQGSTVITTRGYFNVSAEPSAPRGIPMRVIRTNSMSSNTGLQLCTALTQDDENWCNDISDGYPGKLAEIPLARAAWTRATMLLFFLIGFAWTIFGWIPAACACMGGD